MTLISYAVWCPHCGETIDSKNSYADSRAQLRHHIEVIHKIDPDLMTPYHRAYLDDR